MARRERDAQREQFWREALARFTGSGLSIRQFCRRERLREPSFYLWRRTIAQRDGVASPRGRPEAARRRPRGARPRTAPFVPVVLARESAAAAGVSLELRGGRVLRFDDGLSAERLADFVRALEATACGEFGRAEAAS